MFELGQLSFICTQVSYYDSTSQVPSVLHGILPLYSDPKVVILFHCLVCATGLFTEIAAIWISLAKVMSSALRILSYFCKSYQKAAVNCEESIVLTWQHVGHHAGHQLQNRKSHDMMMYFLTTYPDPVSKTEFFCDICFISLIRLTLYVSYFSYFYIWSCWDIYQNFQFCSQKKVCLPTSKVFASNFIKQAAIFFKVIILVFIIIVFF